MHAADRSDAYLAQRSKLDKSVLTRILDAESKVLRVPELGKPLSNELSGLFSEHIGRWRIIYTYDDSTVYFLHCRKRKEGY